VVFESLEISSRILSKHVSDLLFIFVWTPEITNVGSLSLSHAVQVVVERFFFCYKPLINFK
jgi:hypothetical protein